MECYVLIDREYINNIRLSLTEQDIINIFQRLGVERYENKQDYIIFPTICHNVNPNEASMKLFYYKSNKLFHCYTECGESFDIFRLLEKYYKTRNIKYSFQRDILNFVKMDASILPGINFDTLQYTTVSDKYQVKETPTLRTIPESMLLPFVEYYTKEWADDGITPIECKKFNIKFSISQNKIIIPHYDINNNLVGIRGRALNPEEIEEKGKYRPVTIENYTCAHPLSLNLYGINKTQNAIKRKHYCVVFEGEKSVLLMERYYGNDNVSVASCGSSFHKAQLKLLLGLGVSEIIIAYDKENTTKDNSETYFNKLYKICTKYNHYCNFSFIFDRENLLEAKDSPIDKGPIVFEQLLHNRVRI